ncbi:MAG TPA: nuclear transport factor 2 family protein [Candidatus Limnocylindrales bacterium]|nr:nuclear transport factor 2 family protein [Candidatus Limnocylindrales bacterium]
MTRDDVQAWLDRYAAAWESYDPEAIGDLFSREATYRYHPWEPPVTGREAIVRSWVEPEGAGSSRDDPGTYEGAYQVYAVDGDRAVAVGTSTYWKDARRATLDRLYHNVFLLEFDADGRCRSYTEIYEAQPSG